MTAEENHNACKRSRIGNGGSGSAAAKIGQQADEGGEDGMGKGGGGGQRPWHHPASRIFRVSRASGGKDRHSKVYTAKGLRDRRVRLSVSTAIQFYDLQDRLGLDQPSKAIEWLIKNAASSIAELPTLESSFPEPLSLHPGPGEEKPELDHEVDPGDPQQHQHLSLTKSGCSSTSETSKGSVLSLSRSENRVKARERARERAAKEKDKEESDHQNVNPGLNSQSSFTELLAGGNNINGGAVTLAQVNSSNANCIQKQIRYLPVTATADYFAHAGLFIQAQESGFASHPHLGNGSPMGMVPFNPEMQHFSFLQDNPIPIAAVAAGDYNLNFSISPGLAGFHRGTLQSNSPSPLPHHHQQRIAAPADRSNQLPFFFSAPPSASAATSAENQFPAGFDGRLQLCYSDGYSHSDVKGKGKS